MATTKGILLLNNNDSLETVVKKCNTNFKAVLTQQSQSESIASHDIGDAVDGLIDQIEDEQTARSNADLDLENAIQTVDGKFGDYTKTTDLAAVALSGDYDDLSNTPSFAAVATSGDYNDLINTPAVQSTVIDTDTDNFTASSGFTKMGFRGHKYGNVVTVTVQVSTQNQLTPGNDYNIGNVLAAWRPLEYTGGSGLLCVADFSSAGVIRIQPVTTIPANTGIRVHFSFIVQ